MNTQLIVAVVLFLLSLLGAYVLFKVLKSAAWIKRPDYQAGGALAGFLLIFATLSMTHYKLSALESDDLEAVKLDLEQRIAELRQDNAELRQALEAQKNRDDIEYWTIRGQVVRLDKDPHDNEGISVAVIPHEATRSQFDGNFTLRQVKLLQAERYLRELQFAAEGYYPIDQMISMETASYDDEKKIIDLKDPIELWPQEPADTLIEISNVQSQPADDEKKGA